MSPSPQTVGIFLVPGFALMSYASVVEPLRAANLLADKELYRWVHISPGPGTISASCGATVPCTAKAGDALKLDLLLVCAGGNPTAFKDRKTLQWLRGLAARGLRIGGVSGGPVILAKAGIMDGYHMTVHWETCARRGGGLSQHPAHALDLYRGPQPPHLCRAARHRST